MNKGFLIIAHKNPEYGNFADVLAASIRQHSDLPICLLHDGCFDQREYRTLWDGVSRINPEHNHPFYVKTLLNKYTPFEETIYLDADSFCTSSPDHLFNGADFEAQVETITEGNETPPMTWADVGQLRNHYGFDGPFPEINSSFMHWTKGPKSDAIFTLAEHLYAEDWFRGWRTESFKHYPDELAFNCALALLEHPMQIGGPLFTRYRAGAMPTDEEMKPFPFYSLPGVDATHGHLWRIYKMHIRELGQDLGMRFQIPDRANKAASGRSTGYSGLRPLTRDTAEFVEQIKEIYGQRTADKV